MRENLTVAHGRQGTRQVHGREKAAQQGHGGTQQGQGKERLEASVDLLGVVEFRAQTGPGWSISIAQEAHQ